MVKIKPLQASISMADGKKWRKLIIPEIIKIED